MPANMSLTTWLWEKKERKINNKKSKIWEKVHLLKTLHNAKKLVRIMKNIVLKFNYII
jgi:hypothetical protein